MAGVNSDEVYAALCSGKAPIAKLLADHGIDPTAASQKTNFLHQAAARGHLDVVQALIECGASQCSRDEYGDISLHLAAYNGRTEVARCLIEHGAEIDALGEDDDTPLRLAVAQGHEDTVELLCEKGANVKQTSARGMTIMVVALAGGHVAIARLLLNAGAELDESRQMTWLWDAFEESDCTMLQFLIDTYYVDTSRIPDEIRTMLLHVAAEQRDEEFARFLIMKGFDVDTIDSWKGTVLETAIRKGSLGVVQVLLENGANTDESFHDTNLLYLALESREEDIALYLRRHGIEFDPNRALLEAATGGLKSFIVILLDENASAVFEEPFDVNVQGEDGKTALHLASYRGQADCVQLLLDWGADLEVKDEEGNTPLCTSTLSTARLLIEKGADPSAVNESGQNGLHFALVQRGRADALEYVQLLISHGVDWKRPDEWGRTPLHLCCGHGSPELVALLLQNGVDVTARNKDGNQPLYVTVQTGMMRDVDGTNSSLTKSTVEQIFELLLQHGANINEKGQRGWSVLHQAVYHTSPEVINYLLDHGANLEAGDDDQRTPLLFGCSVGMPACNLETLLLRGANMYEVDKDKRTSLALALHSKSYDVAAKLLSHGYSADAEGILQGDFGTTVLHETARRGHYVLLELLLNQRGIEVEAKNEKGVTALAAAVECENLPCVQVLLKHGADPNAAGICCCPVRHLDPLVLVAARGWGDREGSADVLRSLIDAGGDPNAKNHHNDTPLMCAAQQGRVECLKALLDTGVIEVNAVDDDGDTALNCAVFGSQAEATRLLLRRHDVDRSIKNNLGKTPRALAEEKGDLDVQEVFIDEDWKAAGFTDEQIRLIPPFQKYGHLDDGRSWTS